VLDTKALADATAIIVREHVTAAVSPLLARIAALEARELPVAINGDKGEPGENGADGKDVDPEQLRGLIDAAVAEAVPLAVEAAVQALPPAEKGDKGDAGQDGDRGDKGEPGQDGKDGVGLAGMMIDREGEAVATLTDGRMIKLGPVVGRDGNDGEPGKDGQDGRDGQDLTDIAVTQDGATLEMAFQIGEVRSVYEIELPAGPPGADGMDAYPGEAKGLYDPKGEYRAMDVVGFNGSEWRAKKDGPGELPGPDWMLSVPRGKRGERGERGISGRDGVSPVAIYLKDQTLVATLSDGAELNADLSGLAT
jgi:hypothetical protein